MIFPVTKCLLTADGDYLQQVEEKMKAYWGEKLSICRSEPYFLEVTANGIDKAGTLARVLEQLQLNKQNLVACGDGFNDISMISYRFPFFYCNIPHSGYFVSPVCLPLLQ